MSEIEARLSRLETSNQLMKRAFLVLLALPGAALLMGQSAPDSPPQALILKDAAGAERCFLGVDDDGAAVLRLHHPGTKAAVVLRLTADGNPQLQCRDVTGATRFGADSRTHGCTRVYLRDQAGKRRAELIVSPTRGPWLRLVGRRH